MKIISFIRNKLMSLDSFQKRMFWRVGITIAVISIIAVVITLIENVGILANVSSLVCALVPIFILYAAYFTKRISICYFVLCIFESCISLPVTFLTKGGMHSGMPLVMAGMFFLLAFIGDDRKRKTAIIVSLIVNVGVFALSALVPSLVVPIGDGFEAVDIIVNFVLIVVGMLILVHAIIDEYLSSFRQEAEIEKNRAQNQIALLEFQLQNNEDVREIRHDLRSHNIEIMEYAKAGDLDGLISYMEEKMDEEDRNAYKIFCMNKTINNLLMVYSRRAAEHGIDLEINAEAYNDLDIDAADLVTIIGNIVDNAIEACLQLDDSKKKVIIDMHPKDVKFIIKVSNACENGFKLVDGFPGGRPGTGISSAITAAKKYYGDLNYLFKNGMLTCKIVLQAKRM